jgi:hypothetical protein
MLDLDKLPDEFLELLVQYAEASTAAYNDDTAASQRIEEHLCGKVLAAHAELIAEVRELRTQRDAILVIAKGELARLRTQRDALAALGKLTPVPCCTHTPRSSPDAVVDGPEVSTENLKERTE